MKTSDPNYTKACDLYCRLMKEGKGQKEALAKTAIGDEGSKLSHSQADRAWYASDLNPKQTVADPNFQGLTEEEKATQIVEWRSQGASWGVIAIRCGFIPRTNVGEYTEGKVQTIFSLTAGVAAEGTRSGKGGRFLADEPRYYLGNMKGIGLEDPKPRSVDPNEAAAKADTVKSVLPKKVTQLRGKAKGRAKRAATAKREQAQAEAEAEGTEAQVS